MRWMQRRVLPWEPPGRKDEDSSANRTLLSGVGSEFTRRRQRIASFFWSARAARCTISASLRLRSSSSLTALTKSETVEDGFHGGSCTAKRELSATKINTCSFRKSLAVAETFALLPDYLPGRCHAPLENHMRILSLILGAAATISLAAAVSADPVARMQVAQAPDSGVQSSGSGASQRSSTGNRESAGTRGTEGRGAVTRESGGGQSTLRSETRGTGRTTIRERSEGGRLRVA